MSKLEELIEELCPDGVEYKTVGEVCTTITDYTAAGSFADIAKNVKYISDGLGYAQLVRTTDLKSSFSKPDNFVYVDEHAFKYLWRVNLDCEALVMPNIGNCGEVYYVTPELFPYENNVLGPNAILVKSETVNTRFLYHLFLDKDFQNKLAKITSSTGQTKFNKTNFKTLTIPIPPLPVQEEIVRILDNFTDLTAELQAELQARAKQYEYYRDELYKRVKDYPTKRLYEVTKISRGVRVVKKELSESEGYPVYQNCLAPMGYYDKKNCDAHSTYVISAGAAGEIGFSDEEFWAADDCLVFSELNGVLNKYIYYFLLTKYDFLKRNVRKASIPRLSRTIIEKLEIPIIPLEEQQKIIDVLDRFNNLCSDIATGLPAEIEARQKQYEYYRNKLLTFKEKEVK